MAATVALVKLRVEGVEVFAVKSVLCNAERISETLEVDDNSALVLVLPYPTAEYLNNENYFCDYYADVEILTSRP